MKTSNYLSYGPTMPPGFEDMVADAVGDNDAHDVDNDVDDVDNDVDEDEDDEDIGPTLPTNLEDQDEQYLMRLYEMRKAQEDEVSHLFMSFTNQD